MSFSKFTKIVATIGPASDSEEHIQELLESGVNVFRFNMKHADIAWHTERILRVQKVADRIGATIGILIDLQGPEIRIETAEKRDIEVKKGGTVEFTFETLTKDDTRVRIPTKVIFDVLAAGDQFSIDDGFGEFVVKQTTPTGFIATAVDTYLIKHRKGLNVPGKKLDLPSLISDDLLKLDMAAKNKVDFVALSFARTRQDIQILREEMNKRHVDAKIMAKVESREALDNIDELIEAADAIMVARGDLGIECPIEELPLWQKTIIAKCRLARKPVLTATQMLQSMIDNARPTRAEATDVANAVFDGTDAVMLSGESANGKFPVKAVQAMAKIAAYNEGKVEPPTLPIQARNNTGLIADAAIAILRDKQPHIDAMVVFTESGYTAQVLSSYRPNVPILAITDHAKTVDVLSLSYGVTGMLVEFPTGAFWDFEPVIQDLLKKKLLKKGQTILVIHGRSWRKPGLTNSVSIWEV